MNMFKIIFSNGQKILFEDIIELTFEQQEKILSYAKISTQVELKNSKSGLKIVLDVNQKKNVITIKDRVLWGKDSKELYKEQIVKFTSHSVDRMIKRYKGDLTVIYFSVIKMIQKAEEISDQAEWKGYKLLIYTFLFNSNNTLNKIAAAFMKRNRRLQVITAMNDQVTERMDFRISQDSEMSEKLLNLRSRLKNRYKH